MNLIFRRLYLSGAIIVFVSQVSCNSSTNIKWQPVDSSFIGAIAYIPASQEICVKMLAGQGYCYAGFSEMHFESFRNAPSKGQFYNAVVKPGHQVRYL